MQHSVTFPLGEKNLSAYGSREALRRDIVTLGCDGLEGI